MMSGTEPIPTPIPPPPDRDIRPRSIRWLVPPTGLRETRTKGKDLRILAEATGLPRRDAKPWAAYLRGNLSGRHWVGQIVAAIALAGWAVVFFRVALEPTRRVLSRAFGVDVDHPAVLIPVLVTGIGVVPTLIGMVVVRWLWHTPVWRELRARLDQPYCFTCRYDLGHLRREPGPFVRCTECGEWTPKRTGDPA